MTQETRLPEHPELEPPLVELAHLRELSQLDAPAQDVRRAVFARVRQTLAQDVHPVRRNVRPRAWALTLGILIAVPSAFAATPAGSALVERTVEWATHMVELVGSAKAPRTGTGAGGVARGMNTVGTATPSVLTANAVSFPAASATEVENASAPPASFATPSAVAQVESRELPQVTPSGKPRVETASTVSWPTSVEQQPNSGTLNAERRLLEGARLRLRAGDASGALELTARHAELFPNGMLTAERQAIIRQAQQIKGGPL